MTTSHGNWFVEQFHLRSPVEEFQEHCRLELERLRSAQSACHDAAHHEAVDLVLKKLLPDRKGATA